MRLGGFTAVLLLLAAGATSAAAAGDARLAAVQVALQHRHLYRGTIDGVDGPATRSGVVALQRRKGLVPDGVVGPKTLAVLGGRTSELGARVLFRGASGLDVAALQFSLAWHGFPSGALDGVLGARTEFADPAFPALGPPRRRTESSDRRPSQRFAQPVGVSPLRLAWPLVAPISDPFGPRGSRFHAGIDLAANAGTTVAAAAPGRVAWAAWRDGGWGDLVVIAHGGGVRTMYAHLSRIDVRVGERVAAGAGRSGASARRETRPGRTCTSRCGTAARRSIRSAPCASVGAMEIALRPANSLTLAALAELFTAAYAGYVLPFAIDEPTLRFMVDAFDIDLDCLPRRLPRRRAGRPREPRADERTRRGSAASASFRPLGPGESPRRSWARSTRRRAPAASRRSGSR